MGDENRRKFSAGEGYKFDLHLVSCIFTISRGNYGALLHVGALPPPRKPCKGLPASPERGYV